METVKHLLHQTKINQELSRKQDQQGSVISLQGPGKKPTQKASTGYVKETTSQLDSIIKEFTTQAIRKLIGLKNSHILVRCMDGYRIQLLTYLTLSRP
jgi:hypothetical protein